jgi:hypothetical protein
LHLLRGSIREVGTPAYVLPDLPSEITAAVPAEPPARVLVVDAESRGGAQAVQDIFACFALRTIDLMALKNAVMLKNTELFRRTAHFRREG